MTADNGWFAPAAAASVSSRLAMSQRTSVTGTLAVRRWASWVALGRPVRPRSTSLCACSSCASQLAVSIPRPPRPPATSTERSACVEADAGAAWLSTAHSTGRYTTPRCNTAPNCLLPAASEQVRASDPGASPRKVIAVAAGSTPSWTATLSIACSALAAAAAAAPAGRCPPGTGLLPSCTSAATCHSAEARRCSLLCSACRRQAVGLGPVDGRRRFCITVACAPLDDSAASNGCRQRAGGAGAGASPATTTADACHSTWYCVRVDDGAPCCLLLCTSRATKPCSLVEAACWDALM